MENEMSYAERVTTIPRPDGHCGALYEEGHQTARRAAAAIAAEADAEIERLRASLFQVSGYLNGALHFAGYADATDAQAAIDHAAALLTLAPDAPA
jgi:hypothetical protein